MDRRTQRDITRNQLRRRNLCGAAAASASFGVKPNISSILLISRLLDNSDPVVREGAIKNLERIGGKERAGYPG